MSALVAMSVGDSADLDRYGYGPEHIDEAVMRIGQSVLGSGARIGYGGALRGPGGGENFTTTLVSVASKSKKASIRDPEPEAMLVNYSAWPFYDFIQQETQAKLYGAVRFVRIDPPGTHPVPPPNPKSTDLETPGSPPRP